MGIAKKARREPSPVFIKELRSRLRHPWAYWALAAYLVALIVPALYFLYRTPAIMAPHGTSVPLEVRVHQTGVLFALLLLNLQLVVITLLAPATTCASFSGERAKGTLVITLLTPLSSREIVQGKLRSSMVTLALFLLASMPLCALSSLFGGISPLDLASLYGGLFAFSLMLGAFGLYCSVRARGSRQAALFSFLGAFGVYVIFPQLLTPFAALYALSSPRTSAMVAQAMNEAPIPLVALSLGALFWGVAQWLLAETAFALDVQRRRWGTFAPPLKETALPPANEEGHPPRAQGDGFHNMAAMVVPLIILFLFFLLCLGLDRLDWQG